MFQKLMKKVRSIRGVGSNDAMAATMDQDLPTTLDATGKEIPVHCPVFGSMFVGDGLANMMYLSSNGCAFEGDYRMAPCLKCGQPVDWRKCTYIGADQAELMLKETGDRTHLFGPGGPENGTTLRDWDNYLNGQSPPTE